MTFVQESKNSKIIANALANPSFPSICHFDQFIWGLTIFDCISCSSDPTFWSLLCWTGPTFLPVSPETPCPGSGTQEKTHSGSCAGLNLWIRRWLLSPWPQADLGAHRRAMRPRPGTCSISETSVVSPKARGSILKLGILSSSGYQPLTVDLISSPGGTGL